MDLDGAFVVRGEGEGLRTGEKAARVFRSEDDDVPVHGGEVEVAAVGLPGGGVSDHEGKGAEDGSQQASAYVGSPDRDVGEDAREAKTAATGNPVRSPVRPLAMRDAFPIRVT